jgi:nucleoside-triphosphatase THEP1
MQIRKAERKVSKARVALAGPSGSGKTLSALLIALGITEDIDKIGLIDTENRSADLYADTLKAGIHIGQFAKLDLEAPYTTERYIEAIKAFEAHGVDVIIIDSLSHAWAGEGGLLEQVDNAGGSGNKFAAWGKITPKQNKFVESILKSKCHIIVTLRSKTEYVLVDNDKGKKEPQKVGMAPIQRDGLEYEFTTMLDLNAEHTATSSKDRTGLFEGQYFKITTDVGKRLSEWLENGVEIIKPVTVMAINTKWIELGLKPEAIDAQTQKLFGDALHALTEPKAQEFLAKLNESIKAKQQQAPAAEGA